MTHSYAMVDSPYTQAFTACAGALDNPSQIDRVQLRSRERLDFCVDAATWYRWDTGQLRQSSALNDPDLPLARWAAEQKTSQYTVIGYRPGRRLVLFDHDTHRFLKGYAPAKFAGRIERHLAGAASAEVAGFNAPALQERLPQLSAYAMTTCAGQTLSINAGSEGSLQRLGAGIARFSMAVEDLEPTAVKSLQQFSMQDEIELLSSLATRTERALGALPERWIRTFAALREQGVSDDIRALCHRDLHDGQLLEQGKQLSLLDYDLLCLAPPELDPGNFIAHLWLRTLQGQGSNPALVDRLTRSVLMGYRSIRNLDRATLTAFCASALLRLALVYAIRPRWQHLGEPLCKAAAATLQRRILPALEITS